MRPITVLSVAYPFAPVSPDTVGGAEQVLAHLDAALVAAGHRSIVVAAEGSHVRGTLVSTPAISGDIDAECRSRAWAATRRAIVTAVDKHAVDIVHLHGIDFHEYLPPAGVPAVVTLHLPPAWYPPRVWSLDRPGTYLHCVSEAQRRACPAVARLLATIPNGVPVDRLAFHCTRRAYAIALGRVCPEKAFHVALDAGTRAGAAVLIGGLVYPYAEHRRYFDEQVAPRLRGGHRFLGPLAFARKRRLLSAARCLVSASVAPETSSLVAMESLACGTPVVAVASGALPEIVDDGVTGFVVPDGSQLADAIAAAGRLDPEACRDAARRRFSLARTIDRYFGLYQQLARRLAA